MMAPDFDQFLQALAFAAHQHRHQRRKGAETLPYINHPIALVHILWHEATIQDPVVLTSALLHDTVEDTGTSFEQIDGQFGPEVGAIVRQLTDDKTLPKATRKQQQIDHAPHLCDRAKLVKLADKIHNLRDLRQHPPQGWSLERRRDYCQWAKQVVDALRGVHPSLEALFDQAYVQAMADLDSPAKMEAC
ncbi:HD domain-containing protein [Halomicronema hongdechloris]|nr:HD domain-containing protein [Halomicronema hongdechloris]